MVDSKKQEMLVLETKMIKITFKFTIIFWYSDILLSPFMESNIIFKYFGLWSLKDYRSIFDFHLYTSGKNNTSAIIEVLLK